MPQDEQDKRADESQEAEKELIAENKRDGAVVHTFDADETPQQKKAEARKLMPKGIQVKHRQKNTALVSDMEVTTTEAEDLPAPSKVLDPQAEEQGQSGVVAKLRHLRSHAPSHAGWRQTGGIDAEGSGDLQEQSTWLESHLPEKLYGRWWHNAGIIVFACFSSWLSGMLGGGLIWVIVLLAVCGTYYNTSMLRVRRNARDDLAREVGKQKLETDTESVEWMNSFLVKFWIIYEPVLAATIIATVDQVLATATPAFLDSLRVSTFTLGTKPPRIEHVKTYPKSEEDIVLMDWRFSFNPNDIDDLTKRQLRNKVNPKVVLKIRIGKGVASKAISVLVEDIAFSGLMRVRIKLMTNFPHVQVVDLSFLERPSFDYVLKPLGGDTFGFDIGFIPGLSGFITEQVHANLGPMMYAPNVFTLNIERMLSGAAVDSAIGVAVVTLYTARGLRNPDNFAGTPDPYVIFSFNSRSELARTKTMKQNANPRWNETKFLLLTTLNEPLTMEVYDFNDYRKDKRLGTATFDMKKLEELAQQENLTLPVVSNAKERGALTFDVRYFPVLEGKKLDDGSVEPIPESETGIVRFTVHQAKDLDSKKSMVGQLSPYLVQYLNGHEIHASPKMKRTNNPVWEDSFEFLVTHRSTCRLGIAIRDDRDFAEDPVVGRYQITLDDLLLQLETGHDWVNLTDASSGRVRLSVLWKPLAMSGIGLGAGGYLTPIGTMRIHIRCANDLKNYEIRGNSDPYVRVVVSGVEQNRTVTVRNTQHPEWDEVLYVQIRTGREKIALETMDYESLSRDRPLGSTHIEAEKYVRKDEEGLYVEHTEKAELEASLLLGKNAKGTLHYNVCFFPCLNVADPEDDETVAKEKKGQVSVQDAKATELISKPEEDTTSSGETAAAAQSSQETKEVTKLRLSSEELLKYNHGVLIFKFIEADLAHRGCFLEVVIDDYMYPSYTTSKTSGHRVKWDETGDVFIRELEFSRMTLRLREKQGADKEVENLGAISTDTMETLRQCLNNPTVVSLTGKDGSISKVKISLKYVPVKMELHQSESIINMGKLSTEIIDGKNLPAADRSGKSDPYVSFFLNGERAFKTKTIKKSLNPTWDESFTTQIASRTGAIFVAKVYDWDIGEKDDLLGQAQIDLSSLEPYQRKELTVPLDGKSGSIRVRFVFRPGYVTRQRQGTSSTFYSAPTRLATGVAGVPIKGVGYAAGGVLNGASFIKHGLRRSKSKEKDMTSSEAHAAQSALNQGGGVMGNSENEQYAVTNDSHVTPIHGTAGESSVGSKTERSFSHRRSSSVASTKSSSDYGSVELVVLEGKGFPSGAKVQVHVKTVGRKAMEFKTKAIKASDPTWNESHKFECSAEQQVSVLVKDHSTFGRSEELGESIFRMDDHRAGDAWIDFGNNRQLKIRTTFKPLETNGSTNSSPRSVHLSLTPKKRSKLGSP